jgi:hypothetical protein
VDLTTYHNMGGLAASSTLYFIFGTLFSAAFVAAFFYIGWHFFNRPGTKSPYADIFLNDAATLTYDAVRHVHAFMTMLPQPENAFFDITKAAVCKTTGRLFPDSIGKRGVVTLKKSLIQQRYPGRYMLWETLTEQQKSLVIAAHDTMEGFQLQGSATSSRPYEIRRCYRRLKPGPLYVDRKTNILVGWKNVPETDLEVLVVQKP